VNQPGPVGFGRQISPLFLAAINFPAHPQNLGHQIEKFGEKLRSIMNWIKQGKIKKAASQASLI
jgi:hypothetical protein